jgi:4-hydroxy-tetrahydrodipicolinate synthase
MYPGHTFVHERGLVRYYRRLAEATDLDLVVYRRGPELTQDVLGDLMELDGVAGIKYAVDDVDGFRKTVADAPGDVAVLNGIAERYALAYAIEGADGYTTGIGNFAPGATLALFEAIEAGDWERARAVQDPMNAIERLREGSGPGNAIAAANNVPVVKHGLELAGLAGGPVREPLEKPPEEVTGRVEDAYERLSRVLTEDAG